MLTAEACFEVLDAGLKRAYLLLQLGEITREDLAATALVGEARFDPAQTLGDRLILLFEAFEPTVNLVKVAKHLAAQLSNLPIEMIEASVDLVESAGNQIEALVGLLEALVDVGELTAEELDQLLVFRWRHVRMSTAGEGGAQVFPVATETMSRFSV